MTFNKKSLLVSALALTSLCLADAAMANRGQIIGVPVRLMANSTQSAWFDGFDVSGQTDTNNNSGLTLNCPMDNNGFISVDINRPGTVSSTDPSGNRLWALALAAEEANKPVIVLVDDTVKDSSGNCIAIWMEM
jgi:hypothetical protein